MAKSRYEILEKLLDLLSHGEAKIKWADKTIVEIEDIETKSKITKDSLNKPAD